jgi:FkbH-like protein
MLELAAEQSEQVKCVVWDLDNTLWHGILAEGANITLREGIPELMRWLDNRGILQSVASKNDYSAAWTALQKLGISEYLLRPKISWLPKSENIRLLAKELNLGLAGFALIDDSVFEREEVRHALGAVTCFDETFITGLREHPRFQGAETEEARNRRRFYQEAAVREAEGDAHGGDITAFLASCNIVLHISAYAPEYEVRAGELVQRTNQLNFSGTKYTAPAFAALVRDETVEKLVLRCSDRFGDYGTIGFAIVRRSKKLIEVLDLMLSCRVQGKLLERALFAHLADREGREGLAIWVNYNQTARNTPARLALASIGFRPNGRADIHGGTGMLLGDCFSMDNTTVTVVSEVAQRTLAI